MSNLTYKPGKRIDSSRSTSSKSTSGSTKTIPPTAPAPRTVPLRMATPTNSPWMSTHTATTFPKLHSVIHTCIKHLTKVDPNSEFSKTWKNLTDSAHEGPDDNHMFKCMTWKQMGKCLNINTFEQYRDFVMTCPKIQDYISLVVQKGAIELGIITTEFKCNETDHHI